MQLTNGTEKLMEFNLIHLCSIVSVFPTLSAFKGFSECGVTAELPLRMARLISPQLIFPGSEPIRRDLKISMSRLELFFNSSVCTSQP